jgi:site-specific DNA recombinase
VDIIEAYRSSGVSAVCNSRPVRQDLLEELVWREVINLLEDATLIQGELDRRLSVARDANPTKQREEVLRRELASAQKSMDRLMTAYQEDSLSLDDLRRRMPELRKRGQTTQAELSSVLTGLADRAGYLRLAETLTSFLERLREAAKTLDVLERHRVVRLLVKEVLVADDAIVIRHAPHLPDAGQGILVPLVRRGISQVPVHSFCA